MVSALLTDAVADPTAVLIALFDPNESLDDFPAKVSTHFSNIFSAADALDEIPPLSIKSPPEAYRERSLVRLRAMIQDTSLSPEMYLAQHSGGRCGGWGLGEDVSDETHNDFAHLRERAVIWAVTIPGESAWCMTRLDGEVTRTGPVHHPPCPHKFPVPAAPHIGVQLKICGNATIVEPLQSTNLYNFIGILTFDLPHANLKLTSPSLVPTLHVIFFQPLLPTIVPQLQTRVDSIDAIRDSLINWIADEGLGGDQLAAEWLLLCCLAKVESRSLPTLPLTLTISRFPSLPPRLQGTNTHTPCLSHMLSQIFPLTMTLPLSLETLNNTDFAPNSRNEDLHSGWFQLPRSTVCLVTESGVTEGHLQEQGVMNLRTIQDVINRQHLSYVFPYSQFSFSTELAFVALGEGRKCTFVQTHVNVPLKSASEASLYKSANEVPLPSQEMLEKYREFVGAAKNAM